MLRKFSALDSQTGGLPSRRYVLGSARLRREEITLSPLL